MWYNRRGGESREAKGVTTVSLMKYYLHILSGLRMKKINECLDRCHELCGKPKALMFADMLWCASRYGSGFYDYMMYGFFDRTAAERDTYLTRVRNKKLVAYMNDPAFIDGIDNKHEFNRRFGAYLRRDQMDGAGASQADFERFMDGRDACFAKPIDGDSGRGVEKLYRRDFDSLEAMFAHIQAKGHCVIEQCLVQHPEMSALYPHAVNCMRIVTDIGDDGKPYINYVVLKSGSGGGYCDNSGQGGLICAVDKQTGVVSSCATDDLIAHRYDVHPDTGVTFLGFRIPLFEQAKQLCLTAAMEIPQVRHIGWDVAITPDGPAFIEGNTYPGTDLCQLYWNTPGRQGLMPFLKSILPNWKY